MNNLFFHETHNETFYYLENCNSFERLLRFFEELKPEPHVFWTNYKINIVVDPEFNIVVDPEFKVVVGSKSIPAYGSVSLAQIVRKIEWLLIDLIEEFQSTKKTEIEETMLVLVNEVTTKKTEIEETKSVLDKEIIYFKKVINQLETIISKNHSNVLNRFSINNFFFYDPFDAFSVVKQIAKLYFNEVSSKSLAQDQ